jgi:tRNA1Val (adenine37-N6)-methyltransferase
MPNSYFKFKQFRIDQDKCAMKVCTDSCLFGAYVSVQHAQRILDIGTGTGLLALMVAQRSDAFIDAVEINTDAAEQAKENFSQSTWNKRLTVYPESLQEFRKYTREPYDVILTNPPFFLSSLKSGNAAKDTAKHTGELLYEDILSFSKIHLKSDGKLYVLLPSWEAKQFAGYAKEYGLYLNEIVAVNAYTYGQCIRHIQTYSFKQSDTITEQILDIREADRVTYTLAFKDLLKEYYLIF